MYIPAAFQIHDPEKLAAFMERHSFATLITHDGQAPYASHLPVLLHRHEGAHGTLVSHMARANPQWKHFAAEAEVLVIFHGPHGYISPAWYETTPAVPTWNYATVHAYGVPVILENHERVLALLRETIATYEEPRAEPWPGELPEEYRDKMMQGIVAFEIPIGRLEGKFKFGQNRPAADFEKVMAALTHAGDEQSRELAKLMLVERRTPGESAPPKP